MTNILNILYHFWTLFPSSLLFLRSFLPKGIAYLFQISHIFGKLSESHYNIYAQVDVLSTCPKYLLLAGQTFFFLLQICWHFSKDKTIKIKLMFQSIYIITLPLIDNGRKQNCKIQFYWIFPTLVKYSIIFAKYACNLPATKGE